MAEYNKNWCLIDDKIFIIYFRNTLGIPTQKNNYYLIRPSSDADQKIKGSEFVTARRFTRPSDHQTVGGSLFLPDNTCIRALLSPAKNL